VTDNGVLQYKQDYLGGIEYRSTATITLSLEGIFHAEGRVFNINTGTASPDLLRYEYAIRDHLGNTRLTFTDKNNSGVVDMTNTAVSEIVAWKQDFLVLAPINGQTSLSNIWSQQQAITAGDEVLAIIPAIASHQDSSAQSIIGRAALSGQDFGKIQAGMRVVIRLEGYPAQQYGAVEGRVVNLSALPQKEAYLVEVSLPNTLHTAYGQSIPFRQEMAGQARIITAERRVLERIFDRLHDLLQNG